MVPSSPIAPSSAPAASAPVAESTPSASVKADSTPSPEKTGSAGKQATAKPPAASQPQTLAAMRQQIDEKLAAIVARDKASREAQLQQNLMQIALQYAETGAFEQARQVARHPALPLDLQTELLAQIDRIAVQIPGQPETQLSTVAAAPGAPAEAAGRNVPSDLIAFTPAFTPAYTPAYTPIGRALPDTFDIPQCSPADAPAQAATPQTPEKKSLPGFGNRVAASLAATVKRSAEQATEKTAQSAAAHSSTKASAERTVAQKATSEKTAAENLTEQRTAEQSAIANSAVKPASAKPSAAKPTVDQATNKATIATPGNNAEKATPLTQPRSLAVALNSAESSAEFIDAQSAGSVSLRTGSTGQARSFDRLIGQPASPIEIMGYWISKPLKEVGIRFPFVSALAATKSEAPTEAQAIDSIETADANLSANSSKDSASPTLSSSSSELADRSSDLLQPALSISPYLLDLKQSLADFKLVAKDAVKLSSPGLTITPQLEVQTVSQKTVTPQVAPTNCFSPSAGSTSVTVSPALARQMGWGNLVFPLPIPAVLTSAFGWRVHPIFGDRRFHAGIDLGAPMGTPVVAAMAGRIVAAGDMGGYGLAVIVETAAGNYRNLYAHLSGIAVRPGTAVQQGTVLGWVGSTGNSTGPHLHFEAHIPTENGWTAIDPLSDVAKTIASRE